MGRFGNYNKGGKTAPRWPPPTISAHLHTAFPRGRSNTPSSTSLLGPRAYEVGGDDGGADGRDGWFLDFLIYRFLDLLIYWFLDFLMYGFMISGCIALWIYWFLDLWIYWFLDLLMYWFIAFLISWFIDLLIYDLLIYWFMDLLIYGFIDVLIDWGNAVPRGGVHLKEGSRWKIDDFSQFQPITEVGGNRLKMAGAERHFEAGKMWKKK